LSQEYHFGVAGPIRPLVQAVAGASEPKTALTVNFEESFDIPALNALALRSLFRLFEPKENLFVRCVTMGVNGFDQQQTSRRRTIIAMLGLNRLAQASGAQPFDLASIRDAVLADTKWVRGVGDLGLLTWFTAEFVPDRLRVLFNKFDFDKAIKTYSDGRQARTGALAWFLAGISHARLAGTGKLPDLTDVAVDSYHLLLENQAESGIFGQAAFPGLLQRACCRRFGTFNDQIWAIYALSTFTRAFQVEEPLEPALNCANSVRALQGELGEWWFLYDKRACRIAKRYPVFAWHQDGTAPVGLLALEEVTGQSFHEPIYKGLSWITGMNALGKDLRSQDQGMIWDSVRPKRQINNYWEAFLSFVNIPRKSHPDTLRILCEATPDHFGWLLYAFGRFGLPKAAVSGKVVSIG
jgi:hypothetical protein